MNHNHHCWICHCSQTKIIRQSTIRRKVDSTSVKVTDNAYGQTARLRKCHRCQFVFADPLPHPSPVKLYKDMIDADYLASSRARQGQMSRILDLAEKYHQQPKKLLDIGASVGLLSKEAQKRGIHADGVEPSKWCVEKAATCHQIKLHCGTLNEFSDNLGKYDLIMLIDVIEHTESPVELLKLSVKHLAPKGLIIIVTPDIGSKTANLMGKYWWHHRVAHIGYYKKESMDYLLNKCKLHLLSSEHSGWRFPLSYICTRFFPSVKNRLMNNLPKTLMNRSILSKIEINLNFKDSRIYIAKAMS